MLERVQQSRATLTHPVEHISEPTDSSGLPDEWVTEDLIPLGITVEVLQNQAPSQGTTFG